VTEVCVFSNGRLTPDNYLQFQIGKTVALIFIEVVDGGIVAHIIYTGLSYVLQKGPSLEDNPWHWLFFLSIFIYL
jgi:hypothetical protein